MNIYFDCSNGISGDMSVGSLLDLGLDRSVLDNALKSMGLADEFSYEIKDVLINSIKATDFNVIYDDNKELHHHNHKHNISHHHRNLDDVNQIIDKASISANAKNLAKKIFNIVAAAEAEVHNKPIEEVHFHEVGAIDSIVDIVSFSVLYDLLKPENVYFSPLSEGQGVVHCAHGEMNVPVPAVCSIASKYSIPLKITDNNGEMVTPTGIAIVAALYENKKLPDTIIIKKTGYGAGKRPYKNPVLRAMLFEAILNN